MTRYLRGKKRGGTWAEKSERYGDSLRVGWGGKGSCLKLVESGAEFLEVVRL